MGDPAFKWVVLFVVCMVNLYGIRCWREPEKLKQSMPQPLTRIYSASTHVRVMRDVVAVWSVFVQTLILICLWNVAMPFLRHL